MSSLIKETSDFKLNETRLNQSLEGISLKLKGRVDAAYVFGSGATGDITPDSDVDLILVVKNPTRPFVQRGFEFIDLFEVFPKLDILVYTKEELENQLADSAIGFWKSVRLSMRQIL